MAFGRRLSAASQGLLAIISGTAAGQLIALAASPVISRLFPPGVFGPFAVINAVALTLAVIAALRLELALPMPVEEREARALVGLAFRVIGVTCLLGCALALLAGGPISGLLGLSVGARAILLWAPVIAGLMGVYMVLNQLAIRTREYRAIAWRNLLQASVVTGSQMAAGLLGLGSHGLAAGLALGQGAGVCALAYRLRAQLRQRSTADERRAVGRTYRRFPLVMAPSGLLNSLGLQLPVLLAGTYFGARVAGLLGMTQRVIVLPVALIGLAVSQVFLGEFGAAHRGDRATLMRLFMVASRRLALIGALLAAALLLLGPLLFPLVLGAQWAESGFYAQALAVGVAAQMVASPLSQAIIVTGHTHWQAGWDVSRLILVWGSISIGHLVFGSVLAAIWALGAAMVLSYVALWLIARQAVRRATAA